MGYMYLMEKYRLWLQLFYVLNNNGYGFLKNGWHINSVEFFVIIHKYLLTIIYIM